MICIFSGVKDYTTNKVIKWINHLSDWEVIRVNYDEPQAIQGLSIEVIDNEVSICFNNKIITLNKIKAAWYRKGKNWFFNEHQPVIINDHFNFSLHLNKKISNELSKLSEYVHHLIITQVPCLGSPIENDLNKLIVLEMAKQVGLLVPNFYVSNNIKLIREKLSHSPQMITKAMSDGIYLFDNKETANGYFSYTETIQLHDIDKLPDIIPPSFLQTGIQKKFDLRVFFLVDRCYSIAILSQSDEKTKVDFRKYNDQKPNRNIPYKLPKSIEKKVVTLFKNLRLNTGSIDFVVDYNNNFYFLEVNPVGQFTNFSVSCNYNLEKEIAKTLIDYAEGK
jgi:ATP-GRASP peptide maturase of grasp-with-spasm system